MATILHVETSTDVCSVALTKDGHCIWDKEDHGDGQSSKAAELLPTFVDEAMKQLLSNEKLDAVAISGGPGSYTGLRIGMSMAKGIAYGSDAKLLAIPTLEIMCVPILLGREMEDDALLCPMIDARRMEVFSAIYDRALNHIRETQADIVEADTYKEFLDEHPVYFFGNGAAKCKEVIKHPNAHFIDHIVPLARHMMPLAEKHYHKGMFEDVAYYVPDYGKEYEAKLPKKLL